MHPDIIDIGPITIHSYGLMLALAFVAGVWFFKRRAAIERIPIDSLFNVAYFLIIGGVVGARIAFVLLHWTDFQDNLFDAFNPFQSGQFGISGLNLYGGVLAAIGGACIYIFMKRLPLLAIFDLFAPTLGLGLAISRIGCFLNGCCFGTPTELPWGVTFPTGSIPEYFYGSQPIHPTQLYSSLYGLILFFLLWYILKKKTFDGQVLAVLFVLESLFRFIIEPLRYYEVEMTLPIFGMEATYNQLVAVSLFIIGIIIYLAAPRNLHRNDTPESNEPAL
ncbi:MAG: prolipoprotein diacylglyceryl transferase [Candidatus Zixiibacteriota bacterium]